MRSEVVVSALIGCMACTSPSLQREELDRYLLDPEHGATCTAQEAGFAYRSTYRPVELVAERELRAAGDAGRDSILAQYAGRTYFALEVAQEGEDLVNRTVRSTGPNAMVVSALSFQMAEHLVLVACADTLPALFASYARFYEQARTSSFLIAFPKPPTDCPELEVCLRGGLLGMPGQQFRFHTDDLRRVPALDYTRSSKK